MENENFTASGYCDNKVGNTATRYVKFGMVRDYAYVLGKLATLQSTCIKSALYA
jgi:hypothetical protein